MEGIVLLSTIEKNPVLLVKDVSLTWEAGTWLKRHEFLLLYIFVRLHSYQFSIRLSLSCRFGILAVILVFRIESNANSCRNVVWRRFGHDLTPISIVLGFKIRNRPRGVPVSLYMSHLDWSSRYDRTTVAIECHHSTLFALVAISTAYHVTFVVLFLSCSTYKVIVGSFTQHSSNIILSWKVYSSETVENHFLTEFRSKGA